jgi:hypothetical protein
MELVFLKEETRNLLLMTAEKIYYAGLNWPKFNYEKGLEALKKFPNYHEKALTKWPKGIKETQSTINQLKNKSSKLPEKKLKLESILEAFLDGVKVHSEYYEIYVNPSNHEIDSVAEQVKPIGHEVSWDNAWMHSKEKDNYVRFTAIPEKKVFVWSPWALHQELDRKFGLKDEDVYIHGIARKIDGKWTCVEAHNIPYMIKHHEKQEIKEFLKIDWSWLDRYILTMPLIRKYVPELRRELIEVDKSAGKSRT